MAKASKITATIYTTPSCQACKQAAAWLKKQGLEVTEKDYGEAPFQVWSLPVIVLGDEVGRRGIKKMPRWADSNTCPIRKGMEAR